MKQFIIAIKLYLYSRLCNLFLGFFLIGSFVTPLPNRLHAQDIFIGAQGGLFSSDLPRTFSNHFNQDKLSSARTLTGGFSIEGRFKRRWAVSLNFLHLENIVSFYIPSKSQLLTGEVSAMYLWLQEFSLQGGHRIEFGKGNFSLYPHAGITLLTGWGNATGITSGSWDTLTISMQSKTSIKQTAPGLVFGLRANLDFSNGMFLSAGLDYMTSLSPAGKVSVEVTEPSGIVWVKTKADIYPRGLRFLVGLHYPISRIWRGKEGME